MHYHYQYHLRHHITLGHSTHDNESDTDINRNIPNIPMNNMDNKKEEVVGPALVKSSEVKQAPCQKDECVGTLLVHQADVQELSSAGSPKIVRRMTERIAKAVEHLPEQQIDPDDDILVWQCDI